MECPCCPCVTFTKIYPEAVTPSKGTQLSIGYDLTAINIAKIVNSKTKLYGTGIRVQPPEGFYVEILPRSSLSKTGYMLSNSVGIIDPDYTQELLIALTKINDTVPDLELPFTKCQLVLRRAEYFNILEVPDITETGRGGFGSTDGPTKSVGCMYSSDITENVAQDILEHTCSAK